MLPNVGDEVQLTDDYLCVDSSRNYLKGLKLDILKVGLRGITTSGPEYNVWFSQSGTVDGVPVDKRGHSLNFTSTRILVFQPWSGGYAPSKQRAVNEDDRCKKCGAMGKVIGMACRCPNCGNTVWGM